MQIPSIPGSGKAVVAGWQYHWSLFPLPAQTRLLQASAGAAPAAKPVLGRAEAWAWFETVPEAVKAEARRRLAVLDEVDTLTGLGTAKTLAVEEIARGHDMGARTIWDWFGMIDGVAPSDRLPYLAPRHRAAARKDTKVALDPEWFERLKGLYLRLGGPSFSQSWRDAERLAKANGWACLPERTARRRFDQEVPRVVQIHARVWKGWSAAIPR
ncbi:DNA-binding domain-containing protein [Rhodovulum sp. P5]|uniref:DNA-binding domain-containing protein n=1 Tax=Rhodovulum sp. P5 TaxID=1564506 RepID=UPI0009D9C9D8|nr:DNA-binding domain-containing protein [Rhodovulum sp. P5]